VELKVFQRDKLERADVSGGEADLGSDPRFEGFRPTLDAEAPGIAGFETGKIVFGPWGGEIVATGAAEGEELGGHHGADGMKPGVVRAGVAETVTIKSSKGGGAAALQGITKDVGGHSRKKKTREAFLV
jgi:hypothetical protein